MFGGLWLKIKCELSTAEPKEKRLIVLLFCRITSYNVCYTKLLRFLSPLIGKSIIRFGERKVLSLEYFSLVLIFIAYATTGYKWVVAVLFILDHIFYNFSIAIRTYFQKVGDSYNFV